jgi:hypothetical protein
MNTQEASSADTTPVVIEQPPLAVDTQPATLQAQDFAPEPQPADDINPDILPPAEPAESRADALARLVNSNLQSNPPLVDYLTADQLREVFLPIIDFMRAFENASHVPVVYAQAGAPGSAQGLDGDLWVNEDTGDLYAKQQGSWRASTRLRGLDGVTPVKGVNYTDGYTPIRGVDYVDLDSLGAYAQELKDSAVHEATAQVTQAVQAVLANVKTTDGKGLVYTESASNPPLTDTLEPPMPAGAVLAPSAMPIPQGAQFGPVTYLSLAVNGSWQQAYDSFFAFTQITREKAGVGLTCQVSDLNGIEPSITYYIPFVDNSAAVYIPVPPNSDTLFKAYPSANTYGATSFEFTFQGYIMPSNVSQV